MPMQMKSLLFSWDEADVTGQAHFKKGNFPFNQDNTLSIVQFPFWNKHGHLNNALQNFLT